MSNKLLFLLILFSLLCFSNFALGYPEKPTIIFDQVEYDKGDTVKITLYNEENIDGFLVDIIYGSDGMDYVEDYDSKYISALGNSATISFHASKGDTYITVEAYAFEKPEYEGGIPSDKATSQIFVSGISSTTDDQYLTDGENENNNNSGIFVMLVAIGLVVIALLIFIIIIITQKRRKNE